MRTSDTVCLRWLLSEHVHLSTWYGAPHKTPPGHRCLREPSDSLPVTLQAVPFSSHSPELHRVAAGWLLPLPLLLNIAARSLTSQLPTRQFSHQSAASPWHS